MNQRARYSGFCSRDQSTVITILVGFVMATLAAAGESQVATRVEFEVVSIKPESGPNEIAGFECRGVDGLGGAAFGARGFLRVPVPQGRCVGRFVLLAQVIGYAYGKLTRDVTGGPDWIRTPYQNTYAIEAKA